MAIIERRIGKGFEGSDRGLVFKVLSRNLPGRTKKTTKPLSQDSRPPFRGSNPGTSQY
jgi:hypothetical protein